ncbi:MAG: HAD family hydrolase [Planctomycetaceae bacterium]
MNKQTAEQPADFAGFCGKQVRAVVFDAVGTVMFPQPSVAAVYQQSLRRHCGVEVSAERATEVVRKALQQRSADADLRTSEDSESDFWASLIQTLCPGSCGFQDCFDDLFTHFGDASHWRCFPDVPEAVSQLQTAGLTLAIASNFDLRLNAVCDGLPPLAAISERLISSQIGWRKPAPQFFSAVAEKLNLAPAQILMVGDDLQNDVSGAIAAGMPSAWICRDTAVRFVVPNSAFRLSSLTELVTLLTVNVDSGAATVPQKEDRGRV